MSLDWPNLAVGGAIGFAAGFMANAVYARYHANKLTTNLRRKYAGIAGIYGAFLFQKPPVNPAEDIIDFTKQVGKCQITYKHENILLLRYEELEQPNVWEALIWMETPFVGSMVWRYVKLGKSRPPIEHRFGLKRCVVSSAPDASGTIRQYFYLIGEPPFRREAMQKIS